MDAVPWYAEIELQSNYRLNFIFWAAFRGTGNIYDRDKQDMTETWSSEPEKILSVYT